VTPPKSAVISRQPVMARAVGSERCLDKEIKTGGNRPSADHGKAAAGRRGKHRLAHARCQQRGNGSVHRRAAVRQNLRACLGRQCVPCGDATQRSFMGSGIATLFGRLKKSRSGIEHRLADMGA
jgi:hypothetical protein